MARAPMRYRESLMANTAAFGKSTSVELERLETEGLLRRLPVSTPKPGTQVLLGGRELICLSSNNYLGFAAHPELIEASNRATHLFGCGATGSRLLSGNLDLHVELEKKISQFKGTESALLFNSGYSANIGILIALAGENDLLVCDKLNHASLIDGAKASGAEVRYYRHFDLKRAEQLLSQAPHAQRKFLVTDSVFSMDGDIAPLPDLISLAKKHNAFLIVDEAHSTGVLGRTGRGIFEHFKLHPQASDLGIPGLIQMGTFGKALGGFGAFVACDALTKELLINLARPFIFSTALPPAVLGAAFRAFELLEQEPEWIARLLFNSNYLREGLRRQGWQVPMGETPIIPVIIGDPKEAVRVSEELRNHGVLALAVRPPAVPLGTARIRVSVMATHTEEQINTALKIFEKVRATCK